MITLLAEASVGAMLSVTSVVAAPSSGSKMYNVLRPTTGLAGVPEPVTQAPAPVEYFARTRTR